MDLKEWRSGCGEKLGRVGWGNCGWDERRIHLKGGKKEKKMKQQITAEGGKVPSAGYLLLLDTSSFPLVGRYSVLILTAMTLD